MSESPKTVVTIPELAAELGVGKQKVMAWVESGEIDRSMVYNIGLTTKGRHRLVIDRRAVTKFLAGRALGVKPERAVRRTKTPGLIERW